MGINGLLPELPGGSMPSTKTGFDLLTPLLHDEKNPADMDMGTLVYVCALTHKSTYNDGNYIPALREFQRRLTILTSVYRWKINCVFDGKPPHEKRHEHTRRSNTEDSISITSQFILMCKEVCRGSFIDYIIAPNEADSQVGRCFNEYTSSALVLCRDTDELAYGNKDVVFIDSFYTEDWRRVNMNTPVTDQIKKDYPLYAYYHKYGIKIIHWWAAVCGCDISVNRSGIMGAGKATFMSALQSFYNKVASLLTPRLFSKALQKFGSLACTVEDIEKELARVSDYFSKRGTYYDRAGNIYSVEGKLIQRANKTTRRHMKGELNPKTVAELTADEKRGVASVKPHNLLHNSAVCRDKINGISLPENRSSIDDCIVEELKAMIICRGGSLTGKDGKALTRPQLLLQLKAYMKLEKQKPSSIVYFDRGRCNNGIFAKIDTSERRSLPQMLIDLVNTAGYEPNIHAFFVDLLRYCNEGKFVDDFGTIALEAPEITEAFIVEEFCHIGDSKKQKNIASALKKVMEMDELLYHAVATADDGKSILIVSKQRASQNHDEKTRNKTDYGEKPKFAEYLAMCQNQQPIQVMVIRLVYALVFYVRFMHNAKQGWDSVIIKVVYFRHSFTIGGREGQQKNLLLLITAHGFLGASKLHELVQQSN